MIAIDDLQKRSDSSANLQDYLSYNFLEVYDFLKYQDHLSISKDREKINRYISLNRKTILALDLSDTTTLAFLNLLLDVCERLSLHSSFKFLYDHLRRLEYQFGSRLQAAGEYLTNISTSQDYIDRFEKIYTDLDFAYREEEDTSDRVLATLINYYVKVIDDFGQFNSEDVEKVKQLILLKLDEEEFSFLQHELIKKILKIDLKPFDVAVTKIQAELDKFLGRNKPKKDFKSNVAQETNTDYSVTVNKSPSTFSAIKRISTNEYSKIQSQEIFDSLHRGVNILTEEAQLFAYMYAYGDMHYHKLSEAFSYLPKNFFSKEIMIIDWGCGQGLATMAYFDYLSSTKTTQAIKNVSLNEPSELALKRAFLHVHKFHLTNQIYTVNKDLDSLEKNDFRNYNEVAKLHLFSNILDMDDFSSQDLTSLIETKFAGLNYFICASPYVSNLKTSRINSFMNYFSRKEKFKLYHQVDSKYGEWLKTWTRVIRVFKVQLP